MGTRKTVIYRRIMEMSCKNNIRTIECIQRTTQTVRFDWIIFEFAIHIDMCRLEQHN